MQTLLETTMEMLRQNIYELPHLAKIEIIKKCPLGHQILLENNILESDKTLNTELNKHFPPSSFIVNSWEYKVRTLVNHYKFLFPRLVYDFKEDEKMLSKHGRLEELQRLREKKELIYCDILSVINLFHDV